MEYPAAVTAVLLSMVASAALTYGVHRLVLIETRRRHHDVGSTVFLQLGVLFAVLLAFVFNGAYTEYQDAEQAIDLECGALHEAAMVASTLPPPQARAVLALEARYIQAVIAQEWPDMRRYRRASQTTVLGLVELTQRAARLPTSDPSEVTVKAQLLQLLATAHAEREVRLYQATNGLPGVLWVVLIGFGAVLTIFVAFSGMERFFALSVVGVIFAACVSAILVLVRLLDYPFEGALGLPSADFVTKLGEVSALLNLL